MRLFIRVTVICFLICILIQKIFAGGVSAEPLKSPIFNLNEIRSLHGFLSKHVGTKDRAGQSSNTSEVPTITARVCSCQIVDLESSNYNHTHVALLAEKTNYGGNSDFIIARNRIEKEKKHLKKMFYDKVKMISEIHQTVSCKSLYIKLKTADSQLQLYEILNADSN
jgi:hypothetical protein